MDLSIRLRRPDEPVELADSCSADGGVLPASLHLVGEQADDSCRARNLQKLLARPCIAAEADHGDR